jgi:cellulose biosynthesis protein BcsQ
VLIDCPPSLSMLTLNGLCSAHGVIVPMQCEYFALEGLTDLVNTIKQVHANLNRPADHRPAARDVRPASRCSSRSASSSRPTSATRCSTA